jgi:hypothetical protein
MKPPSCIGARHSEGRVVAVLFFWRRATVAVSRSAVGIIGAEDGAGPLFSTKGVALEKDGLLVQIGLCCRPVRKPRSDQAMERLRAGQGDTSHFRRAGKACVVYFWQQARARAQGERERRLVKCQARGVFQVPDEWSVCTQTFRNRSQRTHVRRSLSLPSAPRPGPTNVHTRASRFHRAVAHAGTLNAGVPSICSNMYVCMV